MLTKEPWQRQKIQYFLLFSFETISNFHPLYIVYRLQSYFYKKENLLSGLIFNKENITIRPEYETVLRFYGYDLDGTTNMLTESKINETVENMTGVTEATDTTMISVGKGEEENDTTTIQPETSETTDEVSETETNTEENTQSVDENEEVTTVASARKRRGRLQRGLKSKNRRDRKQQTMKSPAKRRSRSYYVLLDEEYENEFLLDFPSSTLVPLGLQSDQHHPIVTTRQPIRGKFRDNHPKDLFDNVDSDTVEHIFYLNEIETVRVPFKIYDTVMKYAHVPSLEASVLEIDLDTDYYNLIIIVPDFLDGLRNSTEHLRLHEPNTLRKIRNKLDFHWVKTAVPKFNLKGTTILTNDLQNVSYRVKDT